MCDLNRERARPTRRRLIGSGLLLAGTWTAACVPGQPGGWRPAAGATATGTISYAIWDTPGSAARLQQRIGEFQSKHAGAQIDLMSWDYNTYLDKLQVTYASDSGPDAVNLDMPIVQKYAKMGVFVDQRPLIKADKQLKLADFPQLALDIMTGTKSNALLGIPGGAGPNTFYYNRSLIDAAGKPPPLSFYQSDTWTWDAFLDLARATTQRAPAGEWNVAGCVPGLERCWLASNGGAEFDDPRAPTRCLYDTPHAIEALTLLGELRTRYLVTPVSVQQELGMNDINGFGAGKIALNARWGPPISQYRKQVTFTWGLLPYPKGKGSDALMTFDVGTSGIAIAKTCKLPGLAWAWAKYSLDDAGQIAEARDSDGTGAPFNRAAQEEIIKNLKTIPNLETPEMRMELTRKPKGGVVRLLSVDQSDISAIVSEELGKLYTGTNSAPVAAREIASRVNKYLQDHPQ